MESLYINFEYSKLEFDKILNYIAENALSNTGREKILNIHVDTDLNEVKKLHSLLNSLKHYFITESSLGVSVIYNFKKQLLDAAKNIVLKEIPLYELAHSINTYFHLYNSFKKKDFHDLKKIFIIEKLENNFYQEILKYFDKEGNIDSNISPQLKEIRKKISDIEVKIRKSVNSFLKESKKLGYIADEIITFRDGFYCVAVKTNFKNKVDGVILDYSASGQTVYIAPKKTVELHNTMIMCQDEEKKEIFRILSEYTKAVKEYKNELEIIDANLITFDILYAKTLYTMKNEYNSPDIIENKKIKILTGKHPLLGKNAVPLDISIGDDFKILVITGPNTGGKTVVLKTIGLFVLMVQCGIGIPASSTSQFHVFKKIFVDIGDEQSIEQSLSTFSAHQKKIIDIVKNADNTSLVLIDEFGAGTDPMEGSALAMSIINRLKELKSISLLTTHYSALKHFAAQTENVENASMEFDGEKLAPTYKLRIGIPGSSKAFEISKRLGMPHKIVDDAISHMDKDYINMEKLAQKLENERILLEAEKDKFNLENNNLLNKENELKNKEMELMEKEKSIKKLHKQEESAFLKDARKEFENLVRQIRSEKASNETIKKGKNFINKIEEEVKNEDNNDINVKKEEIEIKKDFKSGDEVIVISKNLKGTILKKTNNKNEYLVQVGIIKTNININDLKRAKKKEENYAVFSYVKKSNIQMTLDLRGYRYEDAEMKLDKFIEESIAGKVSTVKIIHGMGTGALRRCIHEYFDNSPFVTSFDYEKNLANNSTNFGVTVAELR